MACESAAGRLPAPVPGSLRTVFVAMELQKLFSNQFVAIKIKKNNLSMEVKSRSLVRSVKRLAFHMHSDKKNGPNHTTS